MTGTQNLLQKDFFETNQNLETPSCMKIPVYILIYVHSPLYQVHDAKPIDINSFPALTK